MTAVRPLERFKTGLYRDGRGRWRCGGHLPAKARAWTGEIRDKRGWDHHDQKFLAGFVEAPACERCRRRVQIGRGVVLELALRARTDVVPADSWLVVRGRRVNVDRLPRALARLVPHGYAHADLAAWKPLLNALEAGGVL